MTGHREASIDPHRRKTGVLARLRRSAFALIAAVTLAGSAGCDRDRETPPPAQETILAPWLIAVVGAAEAVADAQLDPLRALADRGQDDLARTAPADVYALDWSVGRYNIRPSTARAALDWAVARGIAAQAGYDQPQSDEALVRDIMDDARAGALVALILAQLRDGHPILRTLTWKSIESSDQAIAKLYSGYLGAAGDWDAWRSTMVPGEDSRQRLGCNADGSRCTVIQERRPPGGG